MLLGELLARAEQAAEAGSAAALLDDLSLLVGAASAGAGGGIDPEEYVLSAIRRFEREAGAEDRVSLMGAASKAADPGKVCVQRMVRWALQRDQSLPRA